jgi:hypothetical protein
VCVRESVWEERGGIREGGCVAGRVMQPLLGLASAGLAVMLSTELVSKIFSSSSRLLGPELSFIASTSSLLLSLRSRCTSRFTSALPSSNRSV